MKQIIRQNTFETNSSSMHSLCIVKNPVPYDKYDANLLSYEGCDKFNLFDCCDNAYFERYPFQVLNTPKKKLQYWIAHYVGCLNQKHVIKEAIGLVQKITKLPKNKINLKVYDEDDRRDRPYGYAGFNDTGEDPLTYIEKNNISMEEFIMNPKYVIIVDGDEYQEFKHLIDSGVVNLDTFTYISSGKEYWDPRCYKAYINWFRDDTIFNEEILPNLDNMDKYNQVLIEDDNEEIDLANLKLWCCYIKNNYPDIKIRIQTKRLDYFSQNSVL